MPPQKGPGMSASTRSRSATCGTARLRVRSRIRMMQPPLPCLNRVVTLAFAAAALIGCRVDPGPDYARVREHAEHAVGQPVDYRPEEDPVVAAKVAELMHGGLTADKSVRICLLNNRGFQAGWMNIGMAKADLVQSGLLSNPSVDVAVRLPALGGLADVTADLAQNIVDLWQIPIKKQ